ncbi:hypothetical protein [Corynebacterium mastitidis]|uniref:hypothetical protein n=1 Tax=Corynebacterium mastitidis TaxID=161890 RepID=UPI0003AA56BF|nr:hypothetical protein [Corynebacterium mastitidis]
MKADTRKVMVFIAVGILAAATIGLLVWRMSAPGAPAPEQRDHRATARTSSLSTTAAPSPTRTSAERETSAVDSAPEILAQPQRDEQYDSPTVLRAKPTKIYRPDSVSAQNLGNADAAEGARGEGANDAPVATNLALPSGEDAGWGDSPVPTQPPAPTGTGEDAKESEGVIPQEWREGLTPLSEALEQTQEEFSKLPGVSDLPLPTMPPREEESADPSEAHAPDEASEPQEPRDAEARPATTAPAAPAQNSPASQTPGEPSAAPTEQEKQPEPEASQRAALPSSSSPRR